MFATFADPRARNVAEDISIICLPACVGRQSEFRQSFQFVSMIRAVPKKILDRPADHLPPRQYLFCAHRFWSCDPIRGGIRSRGRRCIRRFGPFFWSPSGGIAVAHPNVERLREIICSRQVALAILAQA